MAGKTDYKNKWLSENKERVNLVLSKGDKKLYKALAEQCNMSLNAFIVEAMREKRGRIEMDEAGE